jgi:hypothetical protein
MRELHHPGAARSKPQDTLGRRFPSVEFLLRVALDQGFDVLGLTLANRSQPNGGTVPWEDKDVRLHQQEVFSQDIAKGLSNSEIAEQLYLSPTTIKSHVAGVLAKLSLRDRVQAVVFAYENGIVRPGSTV